MITAYAYSDKDGLVRKDMQIGDKITKKMIWIDLVNPSIEEEKYMEEELNIDIPTREEMDKIEVRSPFYMVSDAVHMTLTVLHRADVNAPDSSAITCVLTPGTLITLRYCKSKVFETFILGTKKTSRKYSNPIDVFAGLMTNFVHSIADSLEKAGNTIDTILNNIFDSPVKSADIDQKQGWKAKTRKVVINDSYDVMIKNTGYIGNIISKSRESLVSLNRILIFFSQIAGDKYNISKGRRLALRNIARDVSSLNEYANFLAHRNSFMLDATLGLINVEQNKIIKVFTMVATILLPPTLISSVYGMNFKHMPGLDSVIGFPLALLMIFTCILLPYMFFRKKDWI